VKLTLSPESCTRKFRLESACVSELCVTVKARASSPGCGFTDLKPKPKPLSSPDFGLAWLWEARALAFGLSDFRPSQAHHYMLYIALCGSTALSHERSNALRGSTQLYILSTATTFRGHVYGSIALQNSILYLRCSRVDFPDVSRVYCATYWYPTLLCNRRTLN
jgi:hypothetical protein